MGNFVFLLFTILFDVTYESQSTLQFVHFVYRHGARSPTEFYPTNPYKLKYWKDGPGWLTNIGKNLEYELGKFIKKRYMEENTILNTSYVNQQVYIRSSDVPRCLQSAESQLAAIYPPQGRQIWNKDLLWQPVPVHSVTGNTDPVLRPDDDECPRLKKLWAQKTLAPEYKEKEYEYKDFLKMMSNYSGMDVTFDNLWIIEDDLRCEAAEKLKSPNWLTPKVKTELSTLSNWIFLNKYQGDDELARLLGGTLLGIINNNMQAYSEGTYDSTLKVIMFSGHDTSLLALTTALDISLTTAPPFAACIMIELYNGTKGYFVQINYRNDSSGNAYPLRLKDCPINCPLEDFLRLTKNRVAEETDRAKNCGVQTRTFFTYERLKVISIVFVCLSLFFIILIIFLLYRKQALRNRLLDQRAAGDHEREHLINS